MSSVDNSDLRQWDIGVWITVRLPASVETATHRKITIRKPNGASVIWDAVQRPTNTDIGYQTVSGDLDVPGEWDIQGWVKMEGGEWTTTRGSFVVGESIAQIVIT